MVIAHTASQFQFTSRYRGKTIPVLTGSSVNFTWSFSGGSDGVFGVPWGIKRDDGIGFINNGVLVSLNPSRSPASFPIALTQEYSGRVGGRLTRNKFSGQAIFTLTSIRKTDETHYGCNLSPINDFEPTGFDNLYLLVEEPPNVTISNVVNACYSEGSPVNISCKATGTPVPDVRWIYKGQVKGFGFKTTHLIFSKISKVDSGVYTCWANNSVGETKKELYFTVTCEYYTVFKTCSFNI